MHPSAQRSDSRFYAGENYGWLITGIDRDPLSDDDLGSLQGEMNEQNGWGPLGTWYERGRVRPGIGFSAEGEPAYFSVEYEIRRIPLPDLIPINIRPSEVGGQQFFCVVLQNIGERAADGFQVTTRTDGTTLLSVAPVPGLGVNQTYEHCVAPQLPAGEHALSFTVDESREIAEMNELNNVYQSKFTFRGAEPQGEPGPQITIADPGAGVNAPPSGPTQPDLLVRAIRVKGKEPEGNNDCDPGKNDVTVVVRNQGDGPAASFIVVFAFNDGQTENNLVQPVTALDAGKELEVLFKDVELKKGGAHVDRHR